MTTPRFPGRFALLFLAASLASLPVGCGAGSSSTGSSPAPAPTPTPVPPPAATLHVTTSTLPLAYAGTAYSLQLSAADGTAPYTWSSSYAPPDLAVSAAGLLTGTPTSGICGYGFQVTVTDASTPKQTANARLTYSAAALVTEFHTDQVGVGSQSAFSLECSPEPISWTLLSGTLPAGLTLTPFPGVDAQLNLNGAPTQAGNFPITVQSTNGAGHKLQLSANVDVLPAPLLSADATNLLATVNHRYSHTVATAGGTAPYTVTLDSGTLPAGLALDPSSGTIAGTPSAPGFSQFTVLITDATNDGAAGTPFSIRKPYTLLVTPASLSSRNDTLATAIPITPGSYTLSLSPYTGVAGSTAPDQDYFLLTPVPGTSYTVATSSSFSLWNPTSSYLEPRSASTEPVVELVDSSGTRLPNCNDAIAASAPVGSSYPRSPGTFTDPCISWGTGPVGSGGGLTLPPSPNSQPVYIRVFDFDGRARPDFLYTLYVTAN